MAVAVGSRLGPYEIVASLGAGGMGEVYRARDTRLDRTVAIKVLAAHRINDPQMRQRFEREARAVAALSHPHICHLNDVGYHDGVDFLVMEYLEGETLAARLARAGRSPLPLDEALRHAIEMAEALNEAHRRGVVHRDLKPGNVMLTRSGVKLLDFGLAKLELSGSAPGGLLSTLGPTKEDPLTDQGSVLGTWPYMSPEQVEGNSVDARSDIFSFGAVLYEMVTSTRAFQGDSQASLIAAILEHHPPALVDRRSAAPPALDRVVRKCLAKQPDARWQSARDLADALKWIVEEGRPASQPRPAAADARRMRMIRRPWAAAALAAIAVGGMIAWNLPHASAPAAPIRRFVVQPPADARLMLPQPRFAMSHDGRALVYTAEGGHRRSLYLRSLDQLEARQIPGTDDAYELALSPDGRWIAFTANGLLKKASLTSGAPPITLVDIDSPHVLDGSIVWLPDNTIVVGIAHGSQTGGGLFRISADGGAMVRLTTPQTAADELDQHFPQPLPGGKALLLTRHLKKASTESFEVAVLQLDTGAVRTIMTDAFDARYVATGHLLFARGQALLAAPFDINRLDVSGPPVRMVDQVMAENNVGGSRSLGWGMRYAFAEDGTLAYIPPPVRTGRRLVWVDAAGRADPLPFEGRAFSRPSLSPDGKRVAVQIEDADGRRDIWVYDLAQATFRPLTSDGTSQAPIWTRDGQRVTFTSSKNGPEEVYWQKLDGSPAEKLVTENSRLYPATWSADGHTLAYLRSPPNDAIEIGWFDVMTRQSAAGPSVQRSATNPRVSPDGRWLAYMAEPGPQVFVAVLSGTPARLQISTEGGFGPMWSRDGNLLYYRRIGPVNGVTDFVAVDVSRLPAIGKSTTMVEDLPAVRGGTHHTGYDVSPDGRLLIVQPAPEESAPLRFELVLNWFDELKQRVPLGK